MYITAFHIQVSWIGSKQWHLAPHDKWQWCRKRPPWMATHRIVFNRYRTIRNMDLLYGLLGEALDTPTSPTLTASASPVPAYSNYSQTHGVRGEYCCRTSIRNCLEAMEPMVSNRTLDNCRVGARMWNDGPLSRHYTGNGLLC